MFLHIKRILVVDDEAELKQAIIRHLRRNGFIMDSAVGNDDAKRKIAISYEIGIPIDLVIRIATIHLADSIEFIEWIHWHHKLTSIAIISGLGNMDWITTNLVPEIDIYAQNPLTPEKLMDLIGDLENKLRNRNSAIF